MAIDIDMKEQLSFDAKPVQETSSAHHKLRHLVALVPYFGIHRYQDLP